MNGSISDVKHRNLDNSLLMSRLTLVLYQVVFFIVTKNCHDVNC